MRMISHGHFLKKFPLRFLISVQWVVVSQQGTSSSPDRSVQDIPICWGLDLGILVRVSKTYLVKVIYDRYQNCLLYFYVMRSLKLGGLT